MSETLDQLGIKYPPFSEAQAATLAPHLASNPAFIEALLDNRDFIVGLANALGIPERSIRYQRAKSPHARRCVRTLGSSLLQVHWGVQARIANALWHSHLSVSQMTTADRVMLGKIRNLGHKYIAVLMNRRAPIPYRALRFDAKIFDKAKVMLANTAGLLRISYREVEDSILAFTTDTFDRAVELFNANEITCQEVIVIGDPPVLRTE